MVCARTNDVWTPEHRAFIDHIMGCKGCYAPGRRYCEVGNEMRLQDFARYVADLPTLQARRERMDFLRREYPGDVERLEQLVREKYREKAHG